MKKNSKAENNFKGIIRYDYHMSETNKVLTKASKFSAFDAKRSDLLDEVAAPSCNKTKLIKIQQMFFMQRVRDKVLLAR